jgi:hypothetical protein
MTLRNFIYEALKRGAQILVLLKTAMECGDYGKTVYGGPAPVDWRKREKLPAHDNWPKRPDGTIDLVVGDQRSGRVRPVKADTFPVIGGALPLVEDAVKVEKEDPGRGPQ